jgi:Ca2+-binding EF-hand superfamily protein
VDEERIQHVFDNLDVGNVGYLTAETIRNVVGQDFSPEDVDNMVHIQITQTYNT